MYLSLSDSNSRHRHRAESMLGASGTHLRRPEREDRAKVLSKKQVEIVVAADLRIARCPLLEHACEVCSIIPDRSFASPEKVCLLWLKLVGKREGNPSTGNAAAWLPTYQRQFIRCKTAALDRQVKNQSKRCSELGEHCSRASTQWQCHAQQAGD